MEEDMHMLIVEEVDLELKKAVCSTASSCSSNVESGKEENEK